MPLLARCGQGQELSNDDFGDPLNPFQAQAKDRKSKNRVCSFFPIDLSRIPKVRGPSPDSR